jgi:hypothetical protein
MTDPKSGFATAFMFEERERGRGGEIRSIHHKGDK